MELLQPLKPKTSLARFIAFSAGRYATREFPGPARVDMYSGPRRLFRREDSVAISCAVYSEMCGLCSSNGFWVVVPLGLC